MFLIADSIAIEVLVLIISLKCSFTVQLNSDKSHRNMSTAVLLYYQQKVTWWSSREPVVTTTLACLTYYIKRSNSHCNPECIVIPSFRLALKLSTGVSSNAREQETLWSRHRTSIVITICLKVVAKDLQRKVLQTSLLHGRDGNVYAEKHLIFSNERDMRYLIRPSDLHW